MTKKFFLFYLFFFFFIPINASEIFTVVIDPGHGGGSIGAVHEDIEEKELTLQLGLKLKDLFAGTKSIKTVFTRTTDVDIPVKMRARQIESLKPDLFISLHFNSQSFLTTNRGFEIYYPADNLSSEPAEMVKNFDRANRSFYFGNIFKEFYLKSEIFTTWKLPFNMFTQKYDLLIFDETTVPGMLFEVAYLTSPDDRACVENDEFISNFANFIYETVVKISEKR